MTLLQLTPEWHMARCGCATGSRIADVIARTKSGHSASRANYAAQLIAERLTGEPMMGSYTSAAIQWGIDHEAQARAAYEFAQDATVEEVGYIPHPNIPRSGASPDGIVTLIETGLPKGLVEIKCPNTSTHIATLLGAKIPSEYITQMHWQMATTGLTWCDFVSFDPRLPPSMSLFIQRLMRDDDTIRHLETEVKEFLDEVRESVAKLTERYGRREAA